MGQNLSGILVYGWDLGYDNDDAPAWAEEFVEELRDGDSYEDVLLARSGFVNPHPDPWDEIRDMPSEWLRAPGKGWGDSDEYVQWRQETDEARSLHSDAEAEALEASGVEIVLCGGEVSGLILSVPGASVESYDWGTQVVDFDWVASLPSLKSRLLDAARNLSLVPDDGPVLLVSASYG